MGTDKDAGHILLPVLFQLFDPFGYVLEGVPSGQIEYYQRTRCSLVVCVSDCPIPLLARSVPDLDLDSLTIQGYRFGGKLDPDGGFGLMRKLVLFELRQQIGFPHSRVCDYDVCTTDDDHFKEKVEALANYAHNITYLLIVHKIMRQ